MQIEIDDKSGFCFGVVRAIDEAEAALAQGGAVFSWLSIIYVVIEDQS